MLVPLLSTVFSSKRSWLPCLHSPSKPSLSLKVRMNPQNHCEAFLGQFNRKFPCILHLFLLFLVFCSLVGCDPVLGCIAGICMYGRRGMRSNRYTVLGSRLPFPAWLTFCSLDSAGLPHFPFLWAEVIPGKFLPLRQVGSCWSMPASFRLTGEA